MLLLRIHNSKVPVNIHRYSLRFRITVTDGYVVDQYLHYLAGEIFHIQIPRNQFFPAVTGGESLRYPSQILSQVLQMLFHAVLVRKKVRGHSGKFLVSQPSFGFVQIQVFDALRVLRDSFFVYCDITLKPFFFIGEIVRKIIFLVSIVVLCSAVLIIIDTYMFKPVREREEFNKNIMQLNMSL